MAVTETGRRRRTGVPALLLVTLAATAGAADWTCRVKVPPTRKGRRPTWDALWLPDPARPVRGLVCAVGQGHAVALLADREIRRVLAARELGALTFHPGFASDHPRLAEFTEKTGRDELPRVPLLLVGQGFGAVHARNDAMLHPDRVIGVIHLKSGNLHHHIPDVHRSLAGVPLLAINGEFEEVGPEGGDVGIGLRTRYAVDPAKATSENQTQWVMLRMQLLERRRRRPDNLLAQVVHRGGRSGDWDPALNGICAAWIDGVARLRLADGPPAAGRATCRAVAPEDGWLMDADLKHFAALPAPVPDYAGDPATAFWYPDFAATEAVFNYHGQGWDVPDPTWRQPPAERFRPPPLLRDTIDGEKAPPLSWAGGTAAWNGKDPTWRDGADAATAWSTLHVARIAEPGATVTLEARLACAGLELDRGATLVLPVPGLEIRGDLQLADDTTLRLVLAGNKVRPGRRPIVLLRGRAALAGTLALECQVPAAPGRYPLIQGPTPFAGSFARILLPPGWTAEVEADALWARCPEPPKEQPKPRKKPDPFTEGWEDPGASKDRAGGQP